MRMPAVPAPPHRRAHQLHSVEAMTPSETSVSIVVDPWRPAAKAARWKGHAPHVTTGIVIAATTHCHPVNCQAGTIDRIVARMPSGAETMRRRRMSAAWARLLSPTWGVGDEAWAASCEEAVVVRLGVTESVDMGTLLGYVFG